MQEKEVVFFDEYVDSNTVKFHFQSGKIITMKENREDKPFLTKTENMTASEIKAVEEFTYLEVK